MEYIKEYMEEELKLKPLGEISVEELTTHDYEGAYGYEILIDRKDTGLQIWWADYANWLERKILIMGGLKINRCEE